MQRVAHWFAAGGVFYGWVILVVVMWLQIATSPGQTFGISSFNPSLQSELELSASELASAYLAGTLLGCLGLPLAGWAMDRFGPKRCLLVITAIFGFSCFGMSRVSSGLQLIVGFTMLRMLGQGALNLCSNSSLAYWFNRRLGLAAGISAIGMALAFAVIPRLMLWSIEQIGWRETFVVLGMIVWSVSWLLLVFFFHDRPESIGLKQDGDRSEPPSAPHTTAETELPLRDISLGGAMRTATFWIVVGVSAIWSSTGTGVVFCLIPIFAERGFSQESAAATFPILAVSMTATQFLAGAAANRLSVRTMLVLACLTTAGGLASLAYLENLAWSYSYALGLGIAHGLLGLVHQVFWPRYYGLQHMGRIRGFVWMTTVASSSAGPFLLGLSSDYLGSYRPVLWAFAAFAAVFTLATAMVRPPDRQPPRPQPDVADPARTAPQAAT